MHNTVRYTVPLSRCGSFEMPPESDLIEWADITERLQARIKPKPMVEPDKIVEWKCCPVALVGSIFKLITCPISACVVTCGLCCGCHEEDDLSYVGRICGCGPLGHIPASCTDVCKQPCTAFANMGKPKNVETSPPRLRSGTSDGFWSDHSHEWYNT